MFNFNYDASVATNRVKKQTNKQKGWDDTNTGYYLSPRPPNNFEPVLFCIYLFIF